MSLLTISRIPTTLKYASLFPDSKRGVVEIMPENVPMGVFVLGGSCPGNGGSCPWDNCPTEEMVLGW